MDENQRIAGLEQDVKALTHTVGGLESDVKNVIRSVESMSDSVKTLAQKISSEQKTNWSVLAAWASVVIGIISALGILALQPLQTETEKLELRFYKHDHLGSHPEARIRLEYLEKEIKAIRDEQLRRTEKVYKKDRQ